LVVDEQKVAEASYTDGVKVGSEIAGFTLDPSNPLAPVTVKGFSSNGPAQKAGALVGWALDVVALLREEKFVALEGEGLGDPPSTLEQVAHHLDEFERRLEALRNLSDVKLVLMNGLEFNMLHQSCVSYTGQKVNDEIKRVKVDGGVMIVEHMLRLGSGKDGSSTCPQPSSDQQTALFWPAFLRRVF